MTDMDRGRRHSRRNSLEIQDILENLELPDQAKDKIKASLDYEMGKVVAAHNDTLVAYNDIKEKVSTIETENDDLLQGIQDEKDKNEKLHDEILKLENENTELIEKCGNDTTLQDEDDKPKIVLFVDKMLEKICDENLSTAAEWLIDDTVTSINDFEKVMGDDDVREKIKTFDRVVLVLGPHEIIEKQTGVSRRYRNLITDLMTLTAVTVIEPPCVRPAGNFSGMRVFVNDVRKKLSEDAQFVATYNRAKEAQPNIWTDDTTVNEHGIKLFANIIINDCIIPERKKILVKQELHDERDPTFTTVMKGTSGSLLRKGGDILKQICQNTGTKITLGRFIERSSDKETEGAIIGGPVMNRKRAISDLRAESKSCADFKAKSKKKKY